MRQISKYVLITLSIGALCIFLLQFSSSAIAQQVKLEKEIENAVKRLQQNKELTEDQINKATTDLEEAQQMLKLADEQDNLAANYEQQAAAASQKIIAIQQDNQQLRNKPANFDETQSIDALENQLLLDIAEQNSRLSTLSKKQTLQTNLSLRANEIAQQLGTVRTNKTEIEEALAKQSKIKVNSLAQASDYKKRANIKKLDATINALQREIATIPQRQSLVEAELVQLRIQTEHYEKIILAMQSQLTKSRRSEVQKTLDRSTQTLSKLKAQPALANIAQENLLLAELLKNIESKSSLNQTNMRLFREKLVEIKQSAETVERVLATGRVTDELGELLRKLRAGLPSESKIETRKSRIEEDAVRQQLDVILWQERLRNMSDIPAAAERLLLESTRSNAQGSNKNSNISDESLSEQALQISEELVIARRVLLRELIEVSNEQSDRIIEEKLVINQLLLSNSELRELLDRRLIWLPSNSGKAGNLAINLGTSIEWFLSPNAWWQLIRDLYKGALASPVFPILLVTLPILILSLRSNIKRRLWVLVDRVGQVERDTYLTTPRALLLTFILALPLPTSLFLIAAIIFNGSEPTGFSKAIATGLASVSVISLILLFFRSMCREDGVFEEHFSWSETARNKLKGMLTWFAWVQCTASFLFATAIASGETELRYGMAIIVFIGGSFGISFFNYLFFKPKNGVATTIVGDTSASFLTLIAFPIVVFAPLAIGALPLFGFFDTAVVLQQKLFLSGTLLVFSAVIYGIMLRIFLVTFRRYLVKKKRLDAQAACQNEQQTNTTTEQGATAIESEDKSIDEKDVKRQSRSILLWIAAILFLAGLWFVWRSLLPALGIVEDIVLWQEVKIVDGVELSSGVTLWNIILSIVFVVGGVVAAKNIRGVMEIGFFEHFEIDNGARYATMTILGYLLVGTGIVLGFSQLGIEWSKLQWIVAALGVGLGFGLQEIVANFVSGLIILFERPIRVGDLVTIGDQSGTVSNIKIRATTVTDFDNREVLLPNKSIITENVTNWTLKDAVTRIVIKIGVAYGSDIEQVRELLVQVLKEQSKVLDHPKAQVFFLEHGESALNFEIRAFVSHPESRFPLTHAINSAANKILKEHNIAIPFPQRDIHIVSGGVNSDTVNNKD